ncbi:hypothetical protein CLV92_106228 [Kineococcus xinjiangensis]|uniref:Thymidine phosphorylase n=1 Tax=Kineococcus xinjiangensis TaxID=512762 RepID=A0A2S6IML8_9ACTN|nr:hypothetical protein [Kineococcus xinjiangensis]PPK95405.1 hypothetical protein CLV92_106228 [Kineococcus xinjiangensis]
MPDAREPHRYHRPVLRGPDALAEMAGGLDPAEREEAAHAVAAALVRGARSADDAEVTRRIVQLAEDEGLDLIASLWADAPPDSLPGALWRLYALRTWVRSDADAVARQFREGRKRAPVHEVVAGVAEPPGPAEVAALVDAVLTGVAGGDLAVTFERAAAFCRVVAVGRAHHADEVGAGRRPHELDVRHGGSDAEDGHDSATAMTRSAGRLLRTAEQLEAAAHRWREDEPL